MNASMAWLKPAQNILFVRSRKIQFLSAPCSRFSTKIILAAQTILINAVNLYGEGLLTEWSAISSFM